MYKVTVKQYLNLEYLDITKLNNDDSITSIPTDEANTDYQAYLKWLEEGGQVIPANE